MYLDMRYVYIHSKNYVPRKAKQLIIWNGLSNKYIKKSQRLIIWNKDSKDEI